MSSSSPTSSSSTLLSPSPGTALVTSRKPTKPEMHAVFTMCRQNRWNSVLDCIRSNHRIPVTSMIMDNHISTTILHQAITSKGDTKIRTRVIKEILDIAPKAAAIKNGYGSLPLHVIAQRNTKLDAPTKEDLIYELVEAYRGALLEQGGVGKRTPLHIIFTDYISPRLTKMMIANGRDACFMKDKKGFLPAHVACSRHCSPEKLDMLLHVHPAALTAHTNAGDTLLSLATSTATKSHPNYALIEDITRRLEVLVSPSQSLPLPLTTSSDPLTRRGTTKTRRPATSVRVSRTPRASKRSYSPSRSIMTQTPPPTRRRKVTADEDDMDSATLLLHFSRQTDKKVLIAKV